MASFSSSNAPCNSEEEFSSNMHHTVVQPYPYVHAFPSPLFTHISVPKPHVENKDDNLIPHAGNSGNSIGADSQTPATSMNTMVKHQEGDLPDGILETLVSRFGAEKFNIVLNINMKPLEDEDITLEHETHQTNIHIRQGGPQPRVEKSSDLVINVNIEALIDDTMNEEDEGGVSEEEDR